MQQGWNNFVANTIPLPQYIGNHMPMPGNGIVGAEFEGPMMGNDGKKYGAGVISCSERLSKSRDTKSCKLWFEITCR